MALHTERHPIIDTHAHLCDQVFDRDLPEVLKRAAEAGVYAIIAVGETLADARRNIELAGLYPSLRPAAGLYPGHADLGQAREICTYIRSEKERLVAIGEVGLDFWLAKEEADKELQREVFSMFIDLSLELGLPLNVHSRSAGRHAMDMLLERGAQKVQCHAFDGKASAALPGVEAGYFFSIPPSVARSRQKQKLVKHLPLSSLLLETDSPVLSSEPGQRNEPANILMAAQAIADLKDVALEAVLEAAFENTRRLYGNL